MTETYDRLQRTRSDRTNAFTGTVRDELARLRGRNLGACAACQQPVFVAQSFTRVEGRLVHVRCPISARTPSAMGPALLPGRTPGDL